ncbi:MAG: VPGUxxT family thioredoxin-like (seleno)protein, type 2 [Luteolibacter sp.]
MKQILHLTLMSTMLAISNARCQPKSSTSNPVAVGTVAWGRDYGTALASAKTAGKPVFLLFQEVPGCAGCQQFGRDVLSNPTVVKTIRENFIPLLIPNNSTGRDAEVLALFNEPAWNYQIVRFLDADGHDLIPRKDHVWGAPELQQRMSMVLKKSGPPKTTAGRVERVAIAQYCFWEGEKTLGGMDGVLRTEAGYIQGREVTLVDYDPAKLPLAELTRKAQAAGVATHVFPSPEGYRKAPEADQKRQLQGTPYARMNLTPEQATKVNAFVRTDPERAAASLTGKRPHHAE